MFRQRTFGNLGVPVGSDPKADRRSSDYRREKGKKASIERKSVSAGPVPKAAQYRVIGLFCISFGISCVLRMRLMCAWGKWNLKGGDETAADYESH
jgi:hypothetical protein